MSAPAEVQHVAIDELGTTLQLLRQGALPPPVIDRELAELPIRVVRTEDGPFEVVDGFKRLARWRSGGASSVPVVVERSPSPHEAKLALLRANAPRRTVTAMDEARVVHALREDGMTVLGIAELAGRRKRWVVHRLALESELSPSLQGRIDEGALGPTLAHALCPLAHDVQEKLVAAIERHRLKTHEGTALISAWQATDSKSEHKRLLDDPLDVLRPARRSANPLGALGSSLADPA